MANILSQDEVNALLNGITTGAVETGDKKEEETESVKEDIQGTQDLDSNILSQEEVNALMLGVTSGEIETESRRDEVEGYEGIKSYDFAAQDRIVRERLPTLEIINERFSRSFRTSLAATLGKTVDVNILSHTTYKFGDFIKTIPVPTSLNILKLEPLRGHALFILDAGLVFMLVDTFFGGSGQTHVKVEGRDFTYIEQRLIKKVVEIARVEIEKAWKPVVPLDISYVRSEVNPHFAGIVPSSDIVMVVSFAMDIEAFSGKVHMCIPYTMLEPIKDKLTTSFQAESMEVDQRWVTRFRELLGGVNVSVAAELGTTTLKVRELAHLKVGDVVLLDSKVDDDLEIRVEGIAKFTGRPRALNDKSVLHITKVINGRIKNA